ncbi:hypothetical protein IGI04_035897 [Brassica rapa subsp. trilocularis]|uniref:Peptidase A2 domain-containing protein n=1 Tax=Brassica rapa subsp. trilocularis TaxID=1813537 RepID=A0ABQ7LCW0_BRACM|nr:hypothetical protein IGI04_035897 [Brassica rapa subsp. trilocularis]
MSSNISCMQQLGIYRYYNLQHLNSGYASNIISNQVTFIIYSPLLVDSIPICMPSGTRSNKEKDLLFSDDPAHLERTIRRGQCSTSLDATTSSSINTHNQPSTDTRPSSSIDPDRSTTIDITPRTSIDTVSSKMVNIIILTQDENGNLYDQAGHLRNATDHDEDRSTDYSSHRSTSSAKSTECNAVRILTHEEFAAKHPHPPSPFYDKIDRSVEPTIDRQSESDVDRHNTPPIDRQTPLTYRVRLPSIDNDYISALRPPPKPLANPPEPKPNPLNSSPESVQEEQESERRRLRKRKEKIPKNLKREANDKKMNGFTKPIEKPFDEAYFTHRLWIFFRETKVIEEDIRRMFHQVREKMKHMITLTKKSDPGKFAIPCIVKGVEFPHSMCDTGASVSILPRIMADQLDIELNWNSSLLLGRSFLATVGPVCDMNKNKLCLTITDPNIHYDPIRPKRKVINSVDYGKELGFIGASHCGAEYESEYEIEYSESIDTLTLPSIDSNESTVTGSWADSGFHESFAVDTDERLETHKFTNTFPTSFDVVHSTSVDTHPRPAKQPLTSIDTHKENSIDISAAAKIQEQENIPSPTRDPDGNARAMDGRILQVNVALQTSIQTDPNNHTEVATTEINPYISRQPKGEASIDGTTETSIDRGTPTSIDRDNSTLIDRRYECGNRAFDMYGARKFTWEQKDEYGVYRDERGHARGLAGEMISVTKDDIRKLLERASVFEESHICLPEHATSFTLTRLAPELYTKDEINEMVFGICGAQEKLGEELKSLQLEKEATTSASIDAPHATLIDVSLPTAQIPAEPQCSTQHRDEWEVSYIDTRINDVSCPLNNNVDWLSTKIELLQQDLDTIRKKDQQPATSIDMCTFTSLDAKV